MNSLQRYLPQDKKKRTLSLLIFDIIISCLASLGAVYVRFDMRYDVVPDHFFMHALQYLPIYIISVVLIFKFFKLYDIYWGSATAKNLLTIMGATAVVTLVQFFVMSIAHLDMPYGYFVLSFAFLTGAEWLLRFSLRIVKAFSDTTAKDDPTIVLYGAGEAGSAILHELKHSNLTEGRVAAILDDDRNKWGRYIDGIKVEGGRGSLKKVLHQVKPQYIYLAMPSATPTQRKQLIEAIQATEAKAKIKVLPGMYQLINGEISVSKMRDVDITDLLGREPIKVNLDEVVGYLKDKVVLVTGGGGSIGSELCRQIANHHPKKLIVFDIYENNVYDLQQELKRTNPDVDIEYLIGSVRNTHRVEEIFADYRPQIVFHAAAHKHVPLMEDSPNEAIKNNVFGTYKVAKAADKYAAERFVLISTDKAVNPTNVMGASKRMCEMIVQMMSRRSKHTNFVAVRFGNVLGSNGSVIPLFKKQIAHGGPVTVTHPDIIRYFMTIPEAVSLVLQAGAYARGGEIFVLNMGDPVKILDLAKNLIRLSGFEPDVDIPIKFTGLRPGEKLYEEMLMEEEGMKDTPNKLIHIGSPIVFDDDHFENELKELNEVSQADTPDIRRYIKKIVPTYVMPEERK